MASLMPQGKQQYFSNAGLPLVGGKVYTYVAGTTTPLATYTDSGGGTPNTNPVILDSRGEASIFFGTANYKIVMKDSTDATIWTQDNLPGGGAASVLASLAASSGSSLVGFQPQATGAAATTVEAQLKTFTGYGSGAFIATNQASGVNALYSITTGYQNHAEGYQSQFNTTTGFSNTSLGYQTLTANTTGANNVAVGTTALSLNTTGGENTAVGCRALGNNSTGNYNTGVGQGALFNNSTGSLNSAFGNHALLANTTGTQNTAVGQSSCLAVTTGNFNVGLGFSTNLAVTTGTGNTALGTASQQTNITGNNNTSVGYLSLYYNTSTNNVAVGYQSLLTNTTGDGNTSVGTNTLLSNTTGTVNTGIGKDALSSNTTGTQNTALGYSASYKNVSGNYNVSVGRLSLYNCTTDDNVAIGDSALVNTTSGTLNTAVGANALAGNVTFSNCSGLGAGANISGSNQIQLGDAATTTYVFGTVQNRSDLNDKADVRDTVLGLDFINALRPVDYKWDMREDYYKEVPIEFEGADGEITPSTKRERIEKDGSKKRNRYHHGLIAQEVQALITASGVDFGGFQDHSKAGGDDVLSIGYDELIAPLIKAVQQLSAEFEAYKAAHP